MTHAFIAPLSVIINPADFTTLSGTATVTASSATVAFTVAQTLAANTPITFSSQPTTVYTIQTATIASTTATLTSNYSGSTTSGVTATTGGSAAFTGFFWLDVPANNVSPKPGAVSQVPWIDSATLALLRAGSIVEQPFISPYLPTAGTLAGTVTVTNGSPTLTFTVAQSLPANTTLTFSNQTGNAHSYTVQTATNSSTSATLTTNFTGSTASGVTVQTGGTQDAFQSAMVTAFNAAQTVLTNSSAPIAGVIGSRFNASWSTVAAGLVVFDPASKLAADIGWAAAAGLIPGVTVGRATGYTPTSSTVNKIVRATAYTPQGTNAQRSLVSTSSADSAAGIGAQKVTLTYLDTSFVQHVEVIATNGTGFTNTVGTDIAYIESMVVTQVGTSGGANFGTISIMTTTGGGGSAWGSIAVNATGNTLSGTATATNGNASVTFTVAQSLSAGQPIQFSNQQGTIYFVQTTTSNSTTATLTANFTGTTASGLTVTLGSGDSQTFWCHHYVPAGITCYVRNVNAAGSSLQQTCLLARTGNPSASNLPLLQIGPTFQSQASGPSVDHHFPSALAIAGPDLIVGVVHPFAATSNTAFFNFEYLQF